MYQPLIKFHPHPAIITQVLRIFEVNLEDTCTRCEKYSSKLDISRLLYVSLGLKENEPINTSCYDSKKIDLLCNDGGHGFAASVSRK